MTVFPRCTRRRALLLAPLALALAAQSTGPTSSDLRGTVSSGGLAVSGAQLRLLREGTGEVRAVRTGADGAFALRLLPPGRYRLDVQAEGLAAWRVADLELTVGTASRLDVRMVREAGARVEVVAEGELTDPARTMVATVIGPDLIASLPISRRSFSDFALTTPAVAVSSAPVNDGSPSSRLSVNGMPARQNNFLLDGLDNNDLGGGAIRSGLSQEAVQEFQVVTGAYGVEYGRALGGIVNTVTKSGGNDFAGSAFYFLRPGSLASDRKGLDLHQYGATAGGAVLKDRLFYFAAFERLRKTDENEVTITPAVASAVRAAGFALETGKLPFEERNFNVLLRLDWVQSAESRFTFRFLYSGEEDGNALRWGGLVAKSAGGRRRTADRTFTASHQWVPNGRFVNEARLLWGRRNSSMDSLDTAASVFVEIQGAASFGTQRLTGQSSAVTYTHFTDTLTGLFGAHTVKAGVDLLRAANEATVPQNFAGIYRFQALDLRPFGVPLYIPTSLDAFQAPNPFGGTGFPAAFIQSYGNDRAAFTSRSEAAFLQDEWQATPSLLIRAGLRYEREVLPPFPDTADYQAIQNPPATSVPGLGPVQLPAGAPVGGNDYPGGFRISRDWSSSRVSPRLHATWTPGGPWRIYGGWGRYSGPTNLGLLYGIRLFNGRDVQTVIRTFIDPALQGPLITWANADGAAANHRYTALPAGPTTFVLPGEAAMPRMDMASLGAEWNPSPHHQVVVDLIRSRSRGLLNVRDVNAYVIYVNPAVSAAPIQRRPDLRYSTLNRADGTGEARHESQSVAWTWKADPALLVKASYTHSRTRDNFIDWTSDFTPQNTFDPASEWGPGVQDQRHRFLASGVWSSGERANPWSRNWTLGWIARWASGRPYTRLAGYDRNYDGDGTSDRPEGVGRTSETLPSQSEVDLRLGRAFRLGAARLEATVEVFNLFNSGNVLEVQNNLGSVQPPYGTPTRYGDRRQWQFGVRYAF
ncbi:MAG: TonB-dependent receptor [Holophagaceae bacterium]|nr:TonB-dependent receptor [Holophagaceae bacterium]